MQYTNKLKGALTETAICTLLRHAGYAVVQSGIESRLSMLPLLGGATVASLDLGSDVRLFPDLAVLPLSSPAYLTEIKYRSQLTRDVLRQLLDKMTDQQRHYPETHTILVRSVSPAGETARADDHIRVLPPRRLELLAAGDIFYHNTAAGEDAPEHLRFEPLWQALRPMSAAFPLLQSQRELLEQLVPVIRSLSAL